MVDVEELQENEEAPVILKNNPFSASVEGVVESYGLPHKGELDPTTIMSFFYVFFFGMMLSDAAYGAIVAIVCAVLVKKFPRMSQGMKKSMKLFFYCGLSTLVWGILFGGYFGSRLMSNIREAKGYTYGISAGIMFYPDSGLLAISTETDNEYVEPLIQEVYHEIDRLHQEPVSAEELTIVRNYMLGEMCRSYESPFSLSDAWIFIATSGLDDDYFSRSLLAVNEVTPMEIQDLAQRYLCKETLKEVIAGKKLS